MMTNNGLMTALAVSCCLCLPGGRDLYAQKPPAPYLASATGHASPPGRAQWSGDLVNRLNVPSGFRIAVFARELGSPRMLAIGSDGIVYVTRRDSGDVLALGYDASGKAGPPRKVVTDMPNVHGIAIHQNRLYLATIREIWVADLRADGTAGEPRALVTDLPDGGQHPNRTIGISPDGWLYVSIGSSCNKCVETNREHATMIRMRLDGSDRGIVATGLRNTVGWDWHPQTRELWGMDHGSDWMGNDQPMEELNRIAGAHYGWPFCFNDRRVDSLFVGNPPGSTKEQLCPGTARPALMYQAHSAPIGFVFYDGTQFPQQFRGDAFVAMRGSWNRNPPTGYKVVRIRFVNGMPARAEDFVTGFLSADRRWYHGRLAGMAVARDGALLLVDDTNGVIYRISSNAPAR